MSRPVELIEAELREARDKRAAVGVLSAHKADVLAFSRARRAAKILLKKIKKIQKKTDKAEDVIWQALDAINQSYTFTDADAAHATARWAAAVCSQLSTVEIYELRQKANETMELSNQMKAAVLARSKVNKNAIPIDNRIKALTRELRKAKKVPE